MVAQYLARVAAVVCGISLLTVCWWRASDELALTGERVAALSAPSRHTAENHDSRDADYALSSDGITPTEYQYTTVEEITSGNTLTSADELTSTSPQDEFTSSSPWSLGTEPLDHVADLRARLSEAADQIRAMRFVSDHTFPANFTLDFLPEYKSPCWRSNGSLSCLPHAFVAGFPKCGTTELYEELVSHPSIVGGRNKEPHWWTRTRFGSYDFDRYRRHFEGSMSLIEERKDERGFHSVVLMEGSASTIWDSSNIFKAAEAPSYLNLHVIRSVLPNSKFVVILREPTSRLYSDFIYFNRGTAEKFHEEVKLAVDFFRACLENPEASFLWCVYAEAPSAPKLYRRLRIGLYSVHLTFFLAVFPRDQIFILQLEHFKQDEAQWLAKVRRFLGVTDEDGKKEEKRQIETNKIANSNTKGKAKAGPMFNETKSILDDFYRPFNALLADFLGDGYMHYQH